MPNRVNEKVHNFIPESAVNTSEEEKTPNGSEKTEGAPPDPFSQENVSPNQPSHQDVLKMPPDDDVLPG